jgi:glucose-6-phosphate-specific signal transduction histidine kinase
MTCFTVQKTCSPLTLSSSSCSFCHNVLLPRVAVMWLFHEHNCSTSPLLITAQPLLLLPLLLLLQRRWRQKRCRQILLLLLLLCPSCVSSHEHVAARCQQQHC